MENTYKKNYAYISEKVRGVERCKVRPIIINLVGGVKM